jgi:hypothetical protein
MKDKLEGPIYIDMTDQLLDLPVRQLVYLTNLALNTMNMRTLAGVLFDAGIRAELIIKEKDDGEVE